ncbi:MAG TPA: hypothetical protein EYP49_06455 [Anaerolineae bacterium]|nr:hypothetical protein [Anaerolineae bacterium]
MPELDPQYISKAKDVVRKKFPEMAGTEPTVSTRKAHSKGGEGVETLYILTFQKGISLQDGGRLMRAVRVTMDQTGRIIRLTSSK